MRLVCPFPPGGTTDLVARLIAMKLTEAWGQQVVVDNRPGAGGVIGTEMVAKAKPGQLNYGSAGTGTSPHLTFELFKRMASIDVVHVPYKGTGPAITDLVGGQVQTMITGVVALMPHVKSGKLRALGVTSAKRVAALPDVPTVAESGVPGFDVSSWFGVFLPAHTPGPIVMKMNAEIRRTLEQPSVRQRLIDQGADPSSNTPEEFAAYVKTEMARWGEVVRSTGARAD
jgi:tripartite-type tricarboxylate transporter receptor subunit TctC